MDSLSHSESQKWILSKVGVRIDGIHAMGSLVRLLKCICEKHGVANFPCLMKNGDLLGTVAM